MSGSQKAILTGALLLIIVGVGFGLFGGAAELMDLSGCKRVPSAAAEEVFGHPITQTNALVESETGGNCIYTIGERDTLVFNYTQSADSEAAQSTFEFQADGFPNAVAVEGVGDEAVWSEELNMLLVRFDSEVMQTRYLENGNPNGQQERLITLVTVLRQ